MNHKEAIKELFAFVLKIMFFFKKKNINVNLNKKEIKKILVLSCGGFGNFILFTPALKALRKIFPDSEIDLLIEHRKPIEKLFCNSKIFDNIYNIYLDYHFYKDIKKILSIKKTRYNLSINTFNSNKILLPFMVFLLNPKYRIGHVNSFGWSSPYGFLYNIKVKMKKDQHEIDRYFELIKKIESDIYLDRRTSISIDNQEYKFASNFLKKHNINNKDFLLGIQLGVEDAFKQWPPNHFIKLLNKISSNRFNIKVIIFGSLNEKELASKIIKATDILIINCVGKITLLQSATLIKRCNLFLCHDSGLMHIANAVNTKLIAIYGPTDITRTKPLNEQNIILRKNYQCIPCFKMEGDYKARNCKERKCLYDISPQQVFDIINKEYKI